MKVSRNDSFDEAFVGKELEDRRLQISRKMVNDYFEGLKVDDTQYLSLIHI